LGDRERPSFGGSRDLHLAAALITIGQIKLENAR
jgi:hypothetical protein